MSMDIILFHSIWTVSLLVLFIGIWVWAWSGKRKRSFDAAARLALDDDAPQGAAGAKKVALRSADKRKLPTKRKRAVQKNG